MKRREDHPIQKHTLNLYMGDYEKLQALYSTRVGAAKIIRDIIRAHIRKVEERAAQQRPRSQIGGEIDLEEIEA